MAVQNMKPFFMIHKKPKKYTCNNCDTFYIRINLVDRDEKKTLQAALKDNLEQADMGYTSRVQDKEDTKGGENRSIYAEFWYKYRFL